MFTCEHTLESSRSMLKRAFLLLCLIWLAGCPQRQVAAAQPFNGNSVVVNAPGTRVVVRRGVLGRQLVVVRRGVLGRQRVVVENYAYPQRSRVVITTGGRLPCESGRCR